jgi:hypothetical protein
MHRRNIPALVALLLLGLGLAACGSSSSSSKSTAQVATTSSTTTTQAASPPAAVNELASAERPVTSQFPAARGRTLQQLATLVHSSAQFGAATGSFTPGTRRVAFALNTNAGAFIYAPTVVYVSSGPGAHDVRGPFPAPADPMSVAPQFRSKQNAGPGGIQAIYEAELPLPHAGTFTLLSLTRTPAGLVGAPGEVAVAAKSPIPDVGQPAPSIITDTHGSVSLLTTRIPPEQMHSVSLNQVLGKKPVALLFSTPQLCTSRVCGPVTDIAVSLQPEFGSRIAFIHEEVYVANQPSKGLRPQMKAFHLETEPWLFTINRHGVIVARLEGAFGVDALRQALEAALR